MTEQREPIVLGHYLYDDAVWDIVPPLVAMPEHGYGDKLVINEPSPLYVWAATPDVAQLRMEACWEIARNESLAQYVTETPWARAFLARVTRTPLVQP